MNYILDGHTPVLVTNIIEWAQWLEGTRANEERRVARTTIGDADVSTVFLALDHSFGDGPPVLFETMVFGGPLDGEQDRYCTWDEAEAGHAAMVQRVNAAQEGT